MKMLITRNHMSLCIPYQHVENPCRSEVFLEKYEQYYMYIMVKGMGQKNAQSPYPLVILGKRLSRLGEGGYMCQKTRGSSGQMLHTVSRRSSSFT